MRTPAPPDQSAVPLWLPEPLRKLSLRHALLGLLLLGALFVATWTRLLPASVSLRVGEVAERTVLAPRTVSYADTARTERLKAVAEQSVPKRYTPDPQANQVAMQALDDFFDQAREVQVDAGLVGVTERMDALGSRVEYPLSEATLRQAVETPPGTLSRLREGAQKLLQTAMSRSITPGNAEELTVAREVVARSAPAQGFSPRFTSLVAEVAGAVLRPNVTFDPVATQAERDRAVAAVKPVTGSLRAGDPVINQGEMVTERHLDAFRALGLMSPELNYLQALSALLVLALVVGGVFFLARRNCPGCYEDFGRMLVLAAVIAGCALVFRLELASRFAGGYGLSAVAAGCMLVSLITVEQMGLAVAAAGAVVLGLLSPDFHVQPVVAVFLSGGIASYLVSRRRTRTDAIVRAALIMGVLNAVLVAVTRQSFAREVPWQLLATAAAGGVGAAVLAMGLMIALDRPLALLTDLRLAELASPHSPLLQRLVREAPGSYQSSVMVASLAEQAAEAIAINSLLVRTAALYHDIGKLKRPYFFVENQFGADNPHDKLSPYMSALIIAAHPRDGAEMGREGGLPASIVEIIEQHQGTDLIRYFYEKAVEAAPEGSAVDATSFRYPGPKPQTKEAAVIMLADAAEAATRTLENPTPERVDGLVTRILAYRIDDGQLDECPLSFRELTRVRLTLVASINGAFYHRIKYPEQIPEEARILAERLSGQPGQGALVEQLRRELSAGEAESGGATGGAEADSADRGA